MQTPPHPQLAKSIERLSILGLALLVWALILLLRLIQLQAFSHEKYVRMADLQQEKLDTIQAPRGAILDRNGNFLAISSDVPIVCVNPLRISDKETAASILSGLLALDREELLDKLTRAAAAHRGYLVVAEKVTESQADAIRQANLDWAEVRKGTARSYPNGSLAAHVIGNVDAEGRGVAGVEKKLNADLMGTPGLIRVTSDVHQRGYNFEVEKQPVMGRNIRLTLNSRLQYVAERALAQAVTAKHALRGSLIAMDPYTGEVLALANYPTYDPNERLKPGEKPHGRENYAVVAPFEPGSVFKVITLSAALETTRLRPETIIDCGNGILHLGSRTIHDEHRYSALPMEDVLAHSSNIGAIHVGMQVGETNMYNYVRNFGFGRRTGIELPAEAPGMLRPLTRWRSGSLPSISMGHEVSVTSVQLAQAAAIVANGGFRIRPRIVLDEETPGEARRAVEQPKPVRVLDTQTVFTMRKMMEHVVLAGTGTKAHVLGYSTAGKTGTAQIFDFAHHMYTHNYNASFMGFAPVTNPSVVVVATVSGTTGLAGMAAQVAAPPFQAVAEEALRLRGVPRDLPAELEEKQGNERRERGDPERDDDLAIADLGEPPTPEDIRAALGDPNDEGAYSLLTASSVAAPKAPNFIGKSVDDVVEEAAERGIAIEAKGRGLARAQRPAPGETLPPGAPVRIMFAR